MNERDDADVFADDEAPEAREFWGFLMPPPGNRSCTGDNDEMGKTPEESRRKSWVIIATVSTMALAAFLIYTSGILSLILDPDDETGDNSTAVSVPTTVGHAKRIEWV